MLRLILTIAAAAGMLIPPATSLAGTNPEGKLVMHLIASADSLGWEALSPAACESIDVDLSVAEIFQAGGYGYVVLLAYDVEAVSGLEFAISGWPTGRGAPALNGPYWIEEDATTFGDHLADGGATGLGNCIEPDTTGLAPLAYLIFGPLDSTDVPITLEILPSVYTDPEDSLLAVTDCSEDFVIDDVLLTSGCTIGATHGTGPDCGGRQEGGREGTGGLLIEEIWSMGEGTLPEGVSLPVRAVWSHTPGEVRLFRPNGEIERDIQLPFPGGGGLLSYLSEDGSIAILRTGVAVRSGGPLSTRVVDVREGQVLFEGDSSGDEEFRPSPDGAMVLHNRLGDSSALRRADLSLIKSTNSLVVKWDFSSEYLATLEVDLTGQDTRRTSLRWPPIKGPLYLRVYDFQRNTVLEEFLDEISAGIDMDIEDEVTIAALYRKYDVARWTPPGTYASSDFVLVIAHVENAEVERRGFTVPRDTRHVQLAISPNRRYLALSIPGLGKFDLHEVDRILGMPDVLCDPSRTCSLPESFPARPDVRTEVSSALFKVSSQGTILTEVACFEGDRSFARVLVSDMCGAWSAVPTPDLEL